MNPEEIKQVVDQVVIAVKQDFANQLKETEDKLRQEFENQLKQIEDRFNDQSKKQSKKQPKETEDQQNEFIQYITDNYPQSRHEEILERYASSPQLARSLYY